MLPPICSGDMYGESAHQIPVHGDGHAVFELGYPEVHETERPPAPAAATMMSRLDVPVHDTPLVGVLEGLAKLDTGLQDVPVAERLLLVHVPQRLALHVLGEQQRLRGLQHLSKVTMW